MVSLVDLWLPILLAAVLVFVASSVIHMLLGWHRSDFNKFAAEDAVMDALRPFAPDLTVFRVTGTIAFAGYALALWQSWIWYSRGLGATVRSTIDGLVYALVIGGAFGSLWP